MQSTLRVISIGISPHVQSLSRAHASSSADALVSTRSVPGVVLWLAAAVGAMTTVVGWDSELQQGSKASSAKARNLFIFAAMVHALGCAPAHRFTIATTSGTIHCDLARDSPRSRALIEHTDYAGRAFFRAIPGVLVQTGSPTDDGSNGSQPRIAIELHEDDAARLAKPGVLLLARYTPPPNRVDPNPPKNGEVIGPQLVIGLVDMSHLAGTVTVAGACRDLDVVRRISETRGARVTRASLQR